MNIYSQCCLQQTNTQIYGRDSFLSMNNVEYIEYIEETQSALGIFVQVAVWMSLACFEKHIVLTEILTNVTLQEGFCLLVKKP